MKTMFNSIHGDKEARLENVVAYPLHGYVRLRLAYIYEKEDGVYRIIIPNVNTMIPTDHIHGIICNEYWDEKSDLVSTQRSSSRLQIAATPMSSAYMDVNGVHLPVHGGSITEFDNISNVYFAERLVSRNVREMTLEEIEERLGYKVKIVNKGE